MKKTPSEIVWLVIKYVIMIAFAIMCLNPLFWLFLTSFKTNQEIYTNIWGLPASWSLENYMNSIEKEHIKDEL